MTKRNKVGIFVLVFTLGFLMSLLLYSLIDLLAVVAFLGAISAAALLIIGCVWTTD